MNGIDMRSRRARRSHSSAQRPRGDGTHVSGGGEGISARRRSRLTAWLPAPGWHRKPAAHTLAADDRIRNQTAAGRIRYQRSGARSWHQPVECQRAGPGPPAGHIGCGAGCGDGLVRHRGGLQRRPVLLASKFAPFPYRVSTAQFASALDKTLDRLGRDSLDLYYLHFPYSPRGIGTWMKAMARAVKAGKIRAVGISNCSVAQMRKAAGVLARYGIPLAANQVHYSLLHRKPETDGVLDACRRMDVALVAYRPLGGGAISAGPPAGPGRSALAGALRDVAATRNATAAQVALAWLLKRDDHVIPIPGATRPDHVRENSGALSLDLSEEELAAIDRASAPTPAR